MNFPWHLFRKNLSIYQNEIMMGFYIYQKRPYPMPRSANYPLRRRTVSGGEAGCDEKDLPESSPKRKPSQLSVSDIFIDGVLMAWHLLLSGWAWKHVLGKSLTSTSEKVLSSLKGKSATSGSLGIKPCWTDMRFASRCSQTPLHLALWSLRAIKCTCIFMVTSAGNGLIFIWTIILPVPGASSFQAPRYPNSSLFNPSPNISPQKCLHAVFFFPQCTLLPFRVLSIKWYFTHSGITGLN